MNNEWKPKAWIAIVLGILIQPFAFLYLNRPKLFWVYFFVVVFTSAIDWYFEGLYSLILGVVCPIHAYFVVKNYDTTDKRNWYSKWWGIPAVYLFLLAPIFIVRAFLYEPFMVPASSMNPTIDVGDHILVKKIGFGTYGIFGVTLVDTDVANAANMKRGKIYAFYPPHMDVPFIKRLIAIPGDTVKIDGEDIVINGDLLNIEFKYEIESGKVYQEQFGENSYLIQHKGYRPPFNTAKLNVPENSYYFLGDNRDNSSDSRVWGFVTSNRIIGEVVHVFR